MNILNYSNSKSLMQYINESNFKCFALQSFVGQPATREPRPSVTKPEAQTPGTDPNTMWTGEILCPLSQYQCNYVTRETKLMC